MFYDNYEIFATPTLMISDDPSKGDGGGESKTERLLSDKSKMNI